MDGPCCGRLRARTVTRRETPCGYSRPPLAAFTREANGGSGSKTAHGAAMAKRSVKKQRREQVASPGREAFVPPRPPETPVWRSSAFWLGGLVVGLAVGAIAVAAFVVLGADDDGPPAAAAPTPTAEAIQSAEELEQQFDERDRQQIEEITTQAKDVAGRLEPVMDGLEEALPRGGGPAAQVADEEVQEWLDTARDALAPYEESISGSTGHNVARSTLRAALDVLVNAIETYRLAGAAGADRQAILARAASQRDNVIRTWSAVSIQIDAINVEAGFGHQHVAQLGGAAAGGQPPDSLPEGTDARPEG